MLPVGRHGIQERLQQERDLKRGQPEIQNTKLETGPALEERLGRPYAPKDHNGSANNGLHPHCTDIVENVQEYQVCKPQCQEDRPDKVLRDSELLKRRRGEQEIEPNCNLNQPDRHQRAVEVRVRVSQVAGRKAITDLAQ